MISKRAGAGVAAALIVAMAVGTRTPSSAAAAPSSADVPCSTARITPADGAFSGTDVSVSTDGTRVVYQRSGSSIALYDEATGETEVIADAQEPAIAGDGGHVVYRDLSRAVWRRTFAPGTPELVSGDLTNSGIVAPSISDNGNTVAFRSMGHPATDTGASVWRWRANGPTLTEAFTTDDDAAELAAPVLSADGSTIAFSTTANVAGKNPDGNYEAFFWRGAPTQITLSAGDNFVHDLNADGRVIAFGSKANYGGQNSDGNLDLFVFDQDAAPLVRQVTVTTGATDGAGPATISDDGSRLVFSSQRNLLGDGAVMPTSELFLHVRGVATHQLTTPASGTLRRPAITGDGQRVFVGSNRNLGGQNPDPVNETHLFRLDCTIPTFGDVPVSHPFFTEIEWVAGQGIASGYDDGTYRPSVAVSRQAMAAFLHRIGDPSNTFVPPVTPTFSDVPTSHPFFADIEWAADEGVAGGFSDGTYRPTAAVSRQAMAAFLHRLGDPGDTFVPPVTPTFTDTPLDHPFFADIEWAAAEEIAGGYDDGSYRPSIAVSRQAMAAFLYRFVP